MPSPIDVTSLRLLRAIAEAGTITAAAAELGYSQPAASQHVRRLERRLGTAVLERHPRGVRLTDAGSILARHGGFVAAAVDAAQREVEALTALETGRVRLVSYPSASASVVPAALVLVREQAPGIEVSVSEAHPREALDLLRQGRCDVVVVDDHPGRPARDTARDDEWSGELSGGLHRRRLVEDPSVLVLPETDPRATRRRLHLRELADDTWATGCPLCRDHLVSECTAAGFTPSIRFETDHVAVLVIVAAGLGISLLPGLASGSAGRHPGVMVRSVSGVHVRLVSALTTGDLARIPSVCAVLDALQEASSGIA